MENNVQQFIESIQELKPDNIKAAQISAGKHISCVPLTFKQQKDLISTVGDGTVGVLRFQKIVNDIIMENSGNDSLIMSDKLPILLKIRSGSIGNIIKIDGGEGDITSSVEKSQHLKFPIPPVINAQVTVELTIPSLKEENKVINHTIEVLKRDGNGDAGKNIGNIYTFEIVKFINSVKFGDNEIKFSNIPVRDRVTIVENLPLSLNKEIVKYIESFKEVENSVLKVEVDGEEKTYDIDVSFFDN
jgi:hypothetical protein